MGQDAALGERSGIIITADSELGLKHAAVAADFSIGTRVGANARACALAGIPILIGVTGFDACARSILETAAKQVAVLIAPNTSIGVGVMAEMVSMAAAALGSSYDVDIAEAHHRTKRDAPSGTALALGEAVARARGLGLGDAARYDAAGGRGSRPPGSIGFSRGAGGRYRRRAQRGASPAPASASRSRIARPIARRLRAARCGRPSG